MSNEAITWAYQQPITTGAKFVLVALADLADEAHSCYPGQAKLAGMTGQGERTVRRQLLELEVAGFLTRARRFDKAGHRTSDRYVLPVGEKIPTGQNGQRPNEPVAKPASGQNGQRSSATSLPAIDDSPTGQNGQVSLSEPKDKPSGNRPRAANDAPKSTNDARFVEFWQTYPRRVGKPDAFKAFVKALRRCDFETILSGAARFNGDPNREDAYTPHPSTWLNRDGWSDDAVPARTAVATAAAPKRRPGWEFGQ